MIKEIGKLLDELNIAPENKISIISHLESKPDRIQRIYYYRAIGKTWREIAILEDCTKQAIQQYFSRNVDKSDFHYIVYIRKVRNEELVE